MSSGTVAATSGPSFTGTAGQSALAAQAFDLMRRQGMLYAADAPITVPLDRLVQGLTRHYPKLSAEKLRAQVVTALDANPAVFTRQETGETVAYVTTKSGGGAANVLDQTRYMFRQRLNGEARDVTEQESHELTEGWIAQAQARTSDAFTIFQEPAAEAAVAGRWSGPADIAAFVAPAHPVPAADAMVFEPDLNVPWVPAEPLPPVEAVRAEEQLPPSGVPDAPPAPEMVAETLPMPTDVAVLDEPIQAAEPAPVVAPVPVPTAPVRPVAPPAPPAPPRPVRFTLPTADGVTTVDLAGDLDAILAEHDAGLTAMLGKALGEDFRFASFGGDWYPEDHVERFSKGDFRRVKDYLIETQEALSDRAFLSDVLNRRDTDPDYERLRFSLNYRLLREKKDFEFVGIPGDRLWIVAGASPVSAPKRKPSELGLDFRYLEDATAQALEPPVPAGTTTWDHALTYYEYESGLLPYSPTARALLPPPMLEDQRAALLRIEVPSLFINFPVELRYPTGNRGGYIVGFDAFFGEYLVPGATFTLEATDQANVLILRFERTAAQEDSLLQYDERRSRFVYRPTTFYAAVSPDWVLREERFARLDSLKRLDESERKKGEAIVSKAFELVGAEGEGRYMASLTDLLPVVNLERPFSPGALRAILETSHHSGFESDPETAGAYFYDPTKK